MIKTLNGIRYRLILAAFTMATSVAGIFAGGLYYAFDTAEDKLFDDHIRADVDTFMALYVDYPAIIDIKNQNFRTYIASTEQTNSLPDFLQNVEPEADEVIIDGAEFELQQRTHGEKTFYFLFDESEFEEFEQSLLMAMVILIVIVIVGAAWSGALIANRIIRPLSDLADQVQEMGHHNHGEINLVHQPGTDKEIIMLAQAINGYHARILELLQRESEFSADVSHELRTPIMAVQGATELLAVRQPDDEKSAELINRIKRGCFHMTTLTEALLYLARDPESFQDLVEPVSVKHVVDSQIAAIRDVAERKGITVNVNESADTTISTIPAVIEIVIGNILKNAVKYTNQNVINIFVENDEVVIQDYGPGIDHDVQASLFDRFNRGHTRNSDGSGIGLALVRRFCEQYGWVIEFNSEQDKGTRVAVAF